MQSAPAFHLKDVTYRYSDDVCALDHVSLGIEAGESVALLGANGSGKSTLLRVLDGLYFPESGSVSVFGEPLTEEHLREEEWAFRFRRRVGLVFQDPDVQLFCPSVFDEVAFGPLHLGWPRPEIRRKVAETLDLLELSHLRDRPPHRLSGGEKKRVALASVLVLDPDVLLLDEPTAGLDPRSESQLLDFLIGWSDGPKTVVTATHDLGGIADIANRAYIFRAGRIVTEGTPEEILGDEALLRSTNLLHVHRHQHGPETRHEHPHRHTHRDHRHHDPGI